MSSGVSKAVSLDKISVSPLPGTLDTFQTFEDAGQSPRCQLGTKSTSGLNYTGAWDVSTSQTVPNNTYADGDYLNFI